MTSFIVLISLVVAAGLVAFLSRRADSSRVDAELARDYRVQREISIARDRQEWASQEASAAGVSSIRF